MSPFSVFQGNCPRNVKKDAKYSVKSGVNDPIVGIIYETREDERWYVSTEDHPELVKMVNDVKTSLGQPPNGSFYINEYKQVIVPAVGTEKYYLAGTYERPLEFKFESKIISGEPVDLDGNPINPGDNWFGPHVGIPYVLCAGAKDIRYTTKPRPNVEKDIKLSNVIGKESAKSVAGKIRSCKGYEGGRFYVNEFCSIFAPIQADDEFKYIYIGKLNLQQWFPAPSQE
jgi:hypothetical protein|tara:strand:- start:152 stop:835 length:684 start_codon:yes stop_codon:yes gene_type:complete